jgi:hypothetical protein
MTRYEQLQHALRASSKRDGERAAMMADEHSRVVGLLIDLVRHVRMSLGLPADDTRVFLSEQSGAQDHFADAIVCIRDHFRAWLDVRTDCPDDTPRLAHILYAMIDVYPLGDQRYQIRFDGIANEHAVEIDAKEPATFDRFADAIFGALRDYYDGFAQRPKATASLGFRPRA